MHDQYQYFVRMFRIFPAATKSFQRVVFESVSLGRLFTQSADIVGNEIESDEEKTNTTKLLSLNPTHWHCIWQSIWHSVWHMFCFFYIPSGIPSYILSDIYSVILFGIISDTLSDIDFDILSDIFSDILFGVLSLFAILPDIFSDTLFGILADVFFKNICGTHGILYYIYLAYSLTLYLAFYICIFWLWSSGPGAANAWVHISRRKRWEGEEVRWGVATLLKSRDPHLAAWQVEIMYNASLFRYIKPYLMSWKWAHSQCIAGYSPWDFPPPPVN